MGNNQNVNKIGYVDGNGNQNILDLSPIKNSIGTLISLTTEAKDNLVTSINEVNALAKKTKLDLANYAPNTALGNLATKVELSGYLKTSDASATYLKSTDASKTYATKIELSKYATLNGNNTFTGATTLAGASATSLSVSGNSALTGTLTVKGATTLAGTTASTLKVTGATAFSASPTVPNLATNDNSTKVANTAFVQGVAKLNVSVPTGCVMAYMGKTVPSGWLLCNGAKISRTTYANLWTALGKPNTGDKSTTFTLPNLTGRFLEGATAPMAYKNAGLPNITGGNISSTTDFFLADARADEKNVGAFILGPYSNFKSYSSGGSARRGAFDASKSNAIYGKSTTVQPNSITTLFIIKV